MPVMWIDADKTRFPKDVKTLKRMDKMFCSKCGIPERVKFFDGVKVKIAKHSGKLYCQRCTK